MTATNRYYTLRYLHSDSNHKAGERIASRDVLHIGQAASSDVQIDNPTDYEDELLAVIKPTADGEGWVLVPISEYVATIVNGTPLKLLHHLEDGDRICFAESRQELVFNVRSDANNALGSGSVKIAAPVSRRLIAVLTLLPLILFGALYWYIQSSNNREKAIGELLDNVRESVWQISVDSVYYYRIVNGDSTVLDSYSYVVQENSAIAGTAFLTTDGTLVTARHCIEPWLNSGEILEKPVDSIASRPVLWALEAETYNQTHSGDTVYAVVSVCEFYKGAKATEPCGKKMLSSAFSYNKANDEIVDLSDWQTEYYWRSIVRRCARTDMMLGDVAVCRASLKGKIALADQDNIDNLAKEGSRLYFMGYPDNEEHGFEKRDGRALMSFSPDRVIAHDGNLIHGYSGGPALAVENGRVYAVGVISVVDKKSSNRMYSVPVTAINKSVTK